MPGLFEELKRRNVFKVGAAYAVLAWLIAQVTDVFLDNFGAPAWVIKTILLLLVIGFPLALFFAWAFELTPEGIKKEKDVDRSRSITHETGRKLDYLIIAVLLVALGFLLVDRFTGSEKNFPAPRTQAPVAAEENVSLTPSIAVLPFVNMSEEASNEYFSDGISEEILNALAKVKNLQVAGRTSSFAFKGEDQDLRQIGLALGVEHILEGSVRKAGTKVRITAQLIRVDNGFHLWSESYDRELTDVFAIQDEIANAILVQLKAHLVGEETPALVAARTNPEAYELYLLARQRMYERARRPLEDAARLLDQALTLDPAYAPAWAQRGVVTELLSEINYGAIPQAEAQRQARLHVDESLRLDPNLAEGWAALGLILGSQPGEAEQTMRALEKALELSPGLIDAANWLSTSYSESAQVARSLELLLDIRKRDPMYRPAVGNLAQLHVARGELAQLDALVEEARGLFGARDPDVLWLSAMQHDARGEFARALSLTEEYSRQMPTDRVYRTQLGLELLQTHQYERAAEEGYRFTRAKALLHLGRAEEAIQLAREWVALGQLRPWFSLLNATGRSDELLGFLESRWPDLADFANSFPVRSFDGQGLMIEVAWAYQRAGKAAHFDQAMAMVRATHDELARQGVRNPAFFGNEAAWHAMAGDRVRALEFLALSVDSGGIYTRRISDDLPWFRDFQGDPEYEAIQARMLEHLNRERAQLGLEPVSA